MTHFDTDSFAARTYREAAALKVEIARMESEYANKVAILVASAVTETGKHTVEGGGSFTISENNVYDEAVMRANLSPGQVKRCTVPKLDKPTVKRLYPAAYEAAKGPGTNPFKVSVS